MFGNAQMFFMVSQISKASLGLPKQIEFGIYFIEKRKC